MNPSSEKGTATLLELLNPFNKFCMEEEMAGNPKKKIEDAVAHNRLSVEELRELWDLYESEFGPPPLCPNSPKLFPPPIPKARN